ncbi:MAG: lamin tail domain-containing protein [Candidatus Yonathbacteria bacterium]|nr:lamin tail domain-containing protein [Candidatus Yonathbacteria bacterium]
MNKMKYLFPFLVLFFARTVSAQVFISEIMYDPEGADTGHEWVEVVNQGSASVDIAQAKFFEEGSNHSLVSVQGSTNLLSGAYAIIADNAQTFLSDHAGFSGIVLDSSFSLKNTGETISFKMPDGSVSDTAVYTGDQGGAGDGNSIHKIDGAWQGAAPTPGNANTPSSEASQTPRGAQAKTPASATGGAAAFGEPATARIIIQSGSTVSGAPIFFSGEAVDSNKKLLDGAYYLWTFGDGETGSGKIASHVFRYPGTYSVALDVSTGYGTPSVSTRIKIAVSPAFLRASLHATTSSAVDIANDGARDIDLSSWIVEADYRRFTFPEHTMLLAGSVITLAPETTGFRAPLSFIKIFYPNGLLYEQALKDVQKNIQAPIVKPAAQARLQEKVASVSYKQTASAADAFMPIGTTTPFTVPKEGSMWPWYIGAAFLAALALLGIRLTREKEEKNTISAEDFEITEDEEPY